MQKTKPGRRRFLKVSLLTGGALLVGTQVLTCCSHHPPALEEDGDFLPNAWIQINPDNHITLTIDRSEMGQGVVTALSMLLAEELAVDIAQLDFVFAPVDPVYNNNEYGIQVTGGSTSIKAAWLPLREAGAMARILLVTAAAKQWGISPQQCHAARAQVIHPKGMRLSYGQLTRQAVEIAVPESISLKEPKDFRMIGKSLPRLDTPAKLNGSARFGIDVRLPGMLIASIAQCPVFGGRIQQFNAQETLRMPGVRHVVALDTAIAVVATHYWQAKKGLDQLLQSESFQWDYGAGVDRSSASIEAEFKAAAQEDAASAQEKGDPEQVLAGAAQVLRAEYHLPYLAHATMEPMNCTAHVRDTDAQIWVGTQNQSAARETTAKITGLSHDDIQVHTTFLGGGFGRRGEQDFVAQAVQIAQQVDAPVQLIWSREEDTQHDFYRPANYHRLAAGLDKEGQATVWTHRVVGPSIMNRIIPDLVPATLPNWLPHGLKGVAGSMAGALTGLSIDQSSVEGASEIPYALPHVQVDHVQKEPGIPIGFWRSVGHSQNAFVVESFMDELAHAGNHDPYQFRHSLLAQAPRYRKVLEQAANQAGWEKPITTDRFRGMALHASFGSIVAQVAEISVDSAQSIHVHRVVCVIDCGMVVNPGIVEAQMESSIVYGLSAALFGEITIAKGRVMQSNFHDYPALLMHQMPKIEVHIMNSTASPSGVGEPGTPPIAPAVANAVFAATGQRLRRLPLKIKPMSG